MKRPVDGSQRTWDFYGDLHSALYAVEPDLFDFKTVDETSCQKSTCPQPQSQLRKTHRAIVVETSAGGGVPAIAQRIIERFISSRPTERRCNAVPDDGTDMELLYDESMFRPADGWFRCAGTLTILERDVVTRPKILVLNVPYWEDHPMTTRSVESIGMDIKLKRELYELAAIMFHNSSRTHFTVAIVTDEGLRSMHLCGPVSTTWCRRISTVM